MSDRFCPSCNMFKDVCLFDEKESGKLSTICMVCTEGRKKRDAARRTETPRPIDAPVREMHMSATAEFPGVDIDRIHHVRGAVRRRKR